MTKPWQTQNWFVSPFNFEPEVLSGAAPPKAVAFHDVTLRDGEQQAGVVFTKYDKIMIGRALNRAGIDRIEVGIPGTSSEDKEAVRALNAATLELKIYSWCRNNKMDIAAAKECGSWGVTLEIPASRVMMRNAYGTTLETVLREAGGNSEYAKSEGLRSTLLLVDSTRSDLQTLEKIIKAAEPYCDSFTISDTFGVAIPQAIFSLVRRVRSLTPKPVEIHCHNDFGLATANTLAAIQAGASVAHITVNGMGERAGNTPLGEVALGVRILLGLDSNVRLDELFRLSRTVATLSGFPVPPNKPVVGENVFNVESAQSAQWLSMKDGLGYAYAFPFSEKLIDHPEPKVTLSKKSGPHNLRLKLVELGLAIPQDRYPDVLGRIYEKSLQKKGAITDDEFLEILEDLGLYSYNQEDLMRA